jgi:hypothetical protein
MSEIEKIVQEVNGTMAIEGMPLTDDDKERIRFVLSGKISEEEIIKQLVSKHAVTASTAYE